MCHNILKTLLCQVDVADVRIKRLDVDVDVDDASPVVGNIITAWVSLDIPNARGAVL